MEPMPRAEADRLLRDSLFGHLALAVEGRAYNLPIYYVYDGEAVTLQSHPGLKDADLRKTREACLVVSRVTAPDDWASVQVFGPVRKLLIEDEKILARAVRGGVPPPPAYGVDAEGTPRRTETGTYLWSLAPERIVGLKSVPKAAPTDVV